MPKRKDFVFLAEWPKNSPYELPSPRSFDTLAFLKAVGVNGVQEAARRAEKWIRESSYPTSRKFNIRGIEFYWEDSRSCINMEPVKLLMIRFHTVCDVGNRFIRILGDEIKREIHGYDQTFYYRDIKPYNQRPPQRLAQ